MAELIGSLLVLAGAVFHLSAGLGILRMPDVYTRMQAGTKASTLGNTLVLGGIGFFHPDWTLPSRLGDNPLVWMLEVNGFMMDIRHCPREVQEIAFQKGLIPYLPADRQQSNE